MPDPLLRLGCLESTILHTFSRGDLRGRASAFKDLLGGPASYDRQMEVTPGLATRPAEIYCLCPLFSHPIGSQGFDFGQLQ